MPTLARLVTPPRLAVLGAAVVACAALVAALALVGVGVVDTRFAAAFSGDEEFIANGVARMLSRPSLSYDFWWYPGFYMMLSATQALVLLVAGTPLGAGALLASRLISAFAYAATILLTGLLSYRLARRARAALLTAVWVASTPAFFEYGITAHPDVLQLAALSAALWCLVVAADSSDRRYLLGGAACAGLAFVTKYAGAFLVPVIAAVALYARLRHAAPGRRREAARHALVADLPRAALAFLAATVVGAPQFWFNLRAYAIGISTHNRNVSYGYFVRETTSGWHWLELLAQPSLLGTAVAALLVVALFVVVVRLELAKDALATPPVARPRLLDGPPALAGYVVVLTYVACYTGFLVYHSRMFEPRYLYPIVPALYALTAAALSAPLSRPAPKVLGATTALALTLLTLLILPARTAEMRATALERLARADHACLAVGAWLEAQVRPEQAIAYDHYTYVPPAYRRVVASWGMSERAAASIDAAVVITTERIRARYDASVNPDTWRHGRDSFLASFAFYRDLEAGRLPDYRLAAEIPGCHGTRIYWRRPPAPATP